MRFTVSSPVLGPTGDWKRLQSLVDPSTDLIYSFSPFNETLVDRATYYEYKLRVNKSHFS